MITINLLPPVKKKLWLRSGHFFIIALALFLLCFGASWGYLYLREQLLLEKLQQIHQQHELLRPTMAQMQAVGAKQQAISARQIILISLTQERPPIYAAIARLGAIIPAGVWLTDVANDKHNMKICGMAQSYQDVALFLQKIQAESIFTDFILVRTEQDKIGAKFEFAVKLKGM